MSRVISRSESWERAYEAYETINFSAFDFDTIKSSMLEYMKLYFPEEFNDYIESSEFIALLELFAYLGELMAYRLDMNAHENFFATAQRKESVLRLAKLISYNASRNIPNRGLVKLTSVTISETVYDSRGLNLSNRKITWNDSNNPDWKEQFLIVMNKVLEQEFGTISPDERIQVNDVLFELYNWNNNPIDRGVFGYTATVSGETLKMELVPSVLNEFGPLEKRPDINGKFSLLYGSDGLGDGSDTTGFFIFTKQGELQKIDASFDGVIPNQTHEVLVDNINETDVWVNNIDPTTNEISDDGSADTGKSGEWNAVDLEHAQNIMFNTNPNRNKYEIETLDNDNIRLIFGDGEFSDVPKGSFHIWVRASVDREVVIPKNTVTNQSASFAYQDPDNNVQTFSFTYSLINTLQNNSPSEDIEHIRRVAPSVYYSQDRMVNGRDYNTFMLQDTTILKMRAINRTFIGDSKYIAWHDASETYEDVKIFGDDLAIYFQDGETDFAVTGESRTSIVVSNYIQPLLASTDIFLILSSRGVTPASINRAFTQTEIDNINEALLDLAATPGSIYLSFDIDATTDNWSVSTSPAASWENGNILELITITVESASADNWIISYRNKRIIMESQKTRFWNSNDGSRVLSLNTLSSNKDRIIVLKANIGYTKLGVESILKRNFEFSVLGQELDLNGLPSIHRFNVLPEDTTNDGIPDNLSLNASLEDIIGLLDETSDGNDVLLYRESIVAPFIPITQTNDHEIARVNELNNSNIDPADRLYSFRKGRYPLNFAWFHHTARFHLVDPSSTNIIDIFIFSRGYYTSLRRWLDGKTAIAPTVPTSLQLRTDYGRLLDNKMISDTVILHPGKTKLLFGKHATDELKATFKVVQSPSGTLTKNQIKVRVVQIVKDFFDINSWEFGETFYFTELATVIHTQLASEIDTVVLVPDYALNQFGDLFQVNAREDEILHVSIDVGDVELVTSLTSQTIRRET